jgi:branched-chain amino acid transport system permease protein
MTCGLQQLSCGEVLAQLLIIGLSNGAIIALNAVSVTLIYSIVRSINFAHGDMFSLATVLAGSLVMRLGLHGGQSLPVLAGGLLLVCAATMLFGAGVNVAVERIGFRPFRSSSRLAPLIATIGISFMLYQAALFARTLTNAVIPGEHRSVPGVAEVSRLNIPDLLPASDVLQALGIRSAVIYPLKDLLIVLATLLVAAGVTWFLRGTRTGRALRACAADPTMARLCGINDTASIRLTFALGGGLAGLAAVVYALYHTSPYTNYGAESGMIAFTAAMLGGIGRPVGATFSGLLLGVLAALSDYFLASQWTPAIILLLMVVLLLVRSFRRRPDDDAAPAGGLVARRPRLPQRWWRWAGWAGAAILLAFPLLNTSLDLRLQVTLTNMLIFGLLALGLNFTVGRAGLLDLGYAACFAIGAYSVGLLSTRLGGLRSILVSGNIVLVVLVSCGVAGAVGWLIGLLTSRLDNEYMALVTFALGVLVVRTLFGFSSLTGGSSGISGVPPLSFAGLRFNGATRHYYVVLTICGLTALAAHQLHHSRIGRAWAAISADETAAASCGVPPARLKRQAFLLSGAIAGLAGALFATGFSYLSPGLAEFRVSALVLIMVILGSGRWAAGPLIGALLVSAYDLIVIPRVGDWFDALRESTGNWFWSAINPRGSNFLSFGLLLYLTVWYRSRRAER